MDPERKKLEELAARIHQAEAKPEAGLEPETRSGRNAGYDFAGTVIGSVILGLLLDRFFGTAPWILLAMVVLGFAAGVFWVWQATRKNEDKEE